MSGLFITSLEQGLIFAILAIGVFITYKILDIADLTVEGSFPLGAFVFAKAVTSGLDPVSGCLLAFLSGLRRIPHFVLVFKYAYQRTSLREY